MAYGLDPWPVIESVPLHWEYKTSATGPPRKPHSWLFLINSWFLCSGFLPLPLHKASLLCCFESLPASQLPAASSVSLCVLHALWKFSDKWTGYWICPHYEICLLLQVTVSIWADGLWVTWLWCLWFDVFRLPLIWFCSQRCSFPTLLQQTLIQTAPCSAFHLPPVTCAAHCEPPKQPPRNGCF